MRKVVLFVGCFALGLAVLGVLVASASPDGLEYAAEILGFAHFAEDIHAWSLFADYEAPFLSSPWLTRTAAALVGMFLIYGFGLLFGRYIRRKGNR